MRRLKQNKLIQKTMYLMKSKWIRRFNEFIHFLIQMKKLYKHLTTKMNGFLIMKVQWSQTSCNYRMNIQGKYLHVENVAMEIKSCLNLVTYRLRVWTLNYV